MITNQNDINKYLQDYHAGRISKGLNTGLAKECNYQTGRTICLWVKVLLKQRKFLSTQNQRKRKKKSRPKRNKRWLNPQNRQKSKNQQNQNLNPRNQRKSRNQKRNQKKNPTKKNNLIFKHQKTANIYSQFFDFKIKF